MVEGGGFEPPKAEPSDLQSDPFGHSGTPPAMWGHNTDRIFFVNKNIKVFLLTAVKLVRCSNFLYLDVARA